MLYQIRLESRGGKHTSVVFCTNGVLLRLLVGRGASKLEASDKPVKDDISALTHILVVLYLCILTNVIFEYHNILCCLLH